MITRATGTFRIYFLLVTLLICFSASLKAQGCPPTDIQASFIAIIVSDIDASIKWYGEKLGFELINRTDLEERGLKQANLKQTETSLELIEIKSAVNTQELLKSSPGGSRIQGLFKFGLTISHFDEWVKHLKSVDIDIHGDVVKDPASGKRMVILKDPDGNRIQLFEE